MVQVCCPVCGRALSTDGPSWRCGAGHGFDVARQGYVNLLTVSQKHSRAPGDSPAQVAARRAFLEAGHYAPLAARVAALLAAEKPDAVLDAGCGEGYYLRTAAAALPGTERWGVDIAKQAVRYAAARDPSGHWLTATAAHLPFRDGSFGCVLAMFALTAAAEFRRVLRSGGLFLQVTAGPDHLLALRRLVYPEVREKAAEAAADLPGFRLEGAETLRFPIHLEGSGAVWDLLAMTPHFMRISPAGADRARAAGELDDEAQAVIRRYRAI